MNKNILIPLVALMVLAMVGATSAEEVTEVEVRATVQNITGLQAAAIDWNATTFAGFYYDLDKDLHTENLTIKAGTLTGVTDRSINKNSLTYRTYPIWREYKLNASTGYTVDSDNTGGDKGYWIEGWMAEKYIAIGGSDTTTGNAKKLSKLLVEFDTDDKKTLSTGEAWDLGSGFTLTANQIDLEGNKVWLSFGEDGKELDSEVIDASSAAGSARVYTYTVDLAGEKKVPVFSCYVDAVFRGTDSNIVQVKYVFLIDNDVLEIKSGDTYGVMEAKTVSNTQIILENDDSSLELSTKAKEHIMGNMYFQVADDSDFIRFYPMVEYTIGDGVTPPEPDETATEAETEPADGNVTDVDDGADDKAEAAATTAPAEEAPTEAPTEEPVEEPTDKPKVPGFEAVFAISGLLAIAYLVLRQRD